MKEKNGYETTEKNNSKGFKLNRKQLYTLSITTNKFLSLFGIKSKCHVNHDDMESMIDPEKMMSAMNDYASMYRNMMNLKQRLNIACYAVNARNAKYNKTSRYS